MKEHETKIKLCGFRSAEPAIVAAQEGVDYLGFVFVPGDKYYIELTQAKQITDQIKQFEVGIVGIFVDEQVETINNTIQSVGLTHVQLHGVEEPEYCTAIDGALVIKAFGVDNTMNFNELLKRLSKYNADFYVLDRIRQGTGDMIPIAFAREAAKHFPIFLAGGITIQNAMSLIREVAPLGIDVASGVDTNGEKDIAKIRELINLVKRRG